ncbi:MAG: FAD-binding domain-containing protein, partial [Pseudomonadota bacterium]
MKAAPAQIVWFKRDLRTFDHQPLVDASAAGPLVPLYVIEPGLWRQPDMALRHYAFIAESLHELRDDLAARGAPLIVRVGDVVDVLADLAAAMPVGGVWSHEETGNGWTFARDQAVADWLRAQGIAWHERRQHGIIRGLANRDGWARAWDKQMGEPVTLAPATLTPARDRDGAALDPGAIPSPEALAAQCQLAHDPCPERQPGGRSHGTALIHSFLHERGRDYRREMSSPVEGAESCSRLSAHFAYGTVSMREVTQATWTRQRALKEAVAALDPQAPDFKAEKAALSAWRASMVSFTGRLHWHCHFMQKLESEPRLEFTELHRHYAGLRAPEDAAGGDRQAAHLAAFAAGETGLPFVDACMRSLRATGWINFRMRAMLQAVASYHLWLPWRDSGMVMARLYTDYEPGIHWSQTQMQSGTTGINTPRIYNPVKQGHDQDPSGSFVRRWVPELAGVPDAFIHTPWHWDDADTILGSTYPMRIVDHEAAARAARTAIWGVRRLDGYRDEANRIQARHGSRKSGIANRGR